MYTREQINIVVNRIVQNANPSKVILFGSYASGEPDENSDVDLLIIKNTNSPRNKRMSEIIPYLRGLKIPMDILVYTENEYQDLLNSRYSIISQIAKKGIVLFLGLSNLIKLLGRFGLCLNSPIVSPLPTSNQY